MSKSKILAAPLLLLASCTTAKFYDHRFQPAPLETQVSTEAVPGAQVRSLVTVIGIERAGDGHAARAVVRMRLENLGTVPVKLETESMSLVTADLQMFGTAMVGVLEPKEPSEGGDELTVDAGKGAGFDLLFPLPEGRKTTQIDLSGLNLRFSLMFGEHRVTTGASFQRVEWPYWDPYYPRVNVGVGFGWTN